MIDKRLVLALTLAFVPLTTPSAAEAQPMAKVPLVVCLFVAPSGTSNPAPDALRQGLRELGYLEGQHIIVEVRLANENEVERLPEIAAELIRRRPNVIVSASNTAVAALRRATQTIPIVAVFGDPIAAGFITSLARPGTNITGFSINSEEINVKWLELLKAVVPHLSRVSVLGWNPTAPGLRQGIEGTAQRMGITTEFVEVRGRDGIMRAFVALARARAAGVIVLPAPGAVAHRRLIVDLAVKHRVPGMYALRSFVEEGGLMSYGPDTFDMFRRSATYVDRILKGAKPADLPVELPTKFSLVINAKTAKAIGLTIPPSLLLRADEIIQ